MIMIMLQLCGDIHLNPGPKYIEICHVNMRSMKSQNRSEKIDELYSELCVLKKYDIICVTETWLDNSILDAEIELKEYSEIVMEVVSPFMFTTLYQ